MFDSSNMITSTLLSMVSQKCIVIWNDKNTAKIVKYTSYFEIDVILFADFSDDDGVQFWHHSKSGYWER